MVACKVAEIGVMALGRAGVRDVRVGWQLWPLYVVLFLMGTHSAFFGPAKYGILPEMLRGTDLPRANGFLLMLTFLAIIFGTASPGFCCRYFGERVVGGFALLHVDRGRWHGDGPVGATRAAANPQLKFELAASPFRMICEAAATGSSAVGGARRFEYLLVARRNGAAGGQRARKNRAADWRRVDELLTGAIGIGIAIGCVIGGLVSGGEVDFRLVALAARNVGVPALLAIPASGDVSSLIGADGR